MRDTMGTWLCVERAYVLSVAALIGCGLAASAQAPTKVIATINGKPIAESDVRIDGSRYRQVLDMQNRHEGKPPLSDSEFEQAKVQHECLRLNGLLWDTMCDREIARRGLTITDEEALELQRQSREGRNLEKDAEAIRSRSKALVVALGEVKAGISLDEAYQKHLKDQDVTPFEWEMMTQRPDYYLAGLRAASATTGEALVPDVSRFKGIGSLQRKLYRVVDEEIGGSDAKFRKYVEALSRGSAPLIYDEYVEKKRREWWTTRYSELNVTLYDAALERECHIQQLGIVLDGSRR